MRPQALGLCALGLVLSAFAPALADDPDQEAGADVMTRSRPEYDARGIRLGAFFFYPSLAAGLGYSDNVFNTAAGVDDYFYSLAPQLKLRSGWARHALNLSFDAKSYWYSNQVGENRTDWNFAADGRLDIVRGTELAANVHYTDYHEPRGTDLTGGLAAGDPAEPTALTVTGFGAEFGHTMNRVRVTLGASLASIDYDDTPRVPPAVPAAINNDDRDRTVTELFARAAVEAGADTAVFVRAKFADHDFDATLDDDGFNRDSDAVGFDAGLEFSMTHLLVGELFAGYAQRSYADPAFASTSELDFGAALKWFPTMLTTISLDGARTIEDTSITAASGYVSTRGQVGLDHEILRNLIMSGRLGYENAEYQGVARNDDILRGSLAGRVLISNHLHFDAGWEFIDRSSSVAPFEYTTSQFLFSLTGKL